jgi:ABC-type sugar transport system substrate-binding protein
VKIVLQTIARLGGALLVLAAGAIHLWLYFDFFHRVHVIGALFLANAAAATVIGVIVLLSANPWVVASGIGFAAATLAAFFVSVYHGLFGYVERLNGSWQLAAGGVEAAAIVLLVPVFVLRVWQTRGRVAHGGTRQAAQAGNRTVSFRFKEDRAR